MPYEQRTSNVNVAPNHEHLVEAVSREFTDRTAPTLSETAMGREYRRPHIIEGVIRNTDRLEVYVVWEGWAGVREEHRTAAILDAYKRAPDPGKVKRVVIALGVTPDEARNLGVIG
jgi:hypothetical protein